MVDKILDVFSNTKNYDIALITTFNFDVSFFERSILNRLYENNVKKVSIFTCLTAISTKLLKFFSTENDSIKIGVIMK